MDNITVINQDYLSFLKEQEDNSFDIIYLILCFAMHSQTVKV